MKHRAPGLARVALMSALACVLAVPGQAAPPRRASVGTGTANPSALVAAELAFARAAREKGQWTAFGEFADDEAVMFAPGPVMAKAWLKGRKNPPQSVQWQPYQVWMSCDGSLGVTKGAWQRADGSVGYFTTVWKRRKKGEYRWVLDQGDGLYQPLPVPDMLSASVADCTRRGGPSPGEPRDHQDAKPAKLKVAGMDGGGQSDDGTLAWAYHAEPDNARRFTVLLRKGGAMTSVLSLSVAGEKP